jgi:hypothetical protein
MDEIVRGRRGREATGAAASASDRGRGHQHRNAVPPGVRTQTVPHRDVIFVLEPDPMGIGGMAGLYIVGVRDPALNMCMRLKVDDLDDYEMVWTLAWVSDIHLAPQTPHQWWAIMDTIKQQAGWAGDRPPVEYLITQPVEYDRRRARSALG